jgi:hypothetical protein
MILPASRVYEPEPAEKFTSGAQKTPRVVFELTIECCGEYLIGPQLDLDFTFSLLRH